MKISPKYFQKLIEEYKIDATLHGRTLGVDLCYPRTTDGRPNEVVVGLSDTRAADSIKISYDFERDGWVIQQATRFCWEANEEPDPKWIEVAFVKAWASRIDEEEE